MTLKFSKHLLLLAVLFALTARMQAQVEITSEDLPGPNENYQLVNVSSLELSNYSEPGGGQVWDFSNLTPITNETAAFGTVSSAPFAYQFLFNNPFDSDHQATHITEGEGIDLVAVSIDEFFFFYKKTASSYNIVGYGGTVSGIPIPSQTNPIDVVYELPMNYEDTHASFSTWNVEIPTLGSYFQEQDRSYEIDAWGTITTPAGTYDALRLRMEIVAEDSVFVDTFGQGFTFTRVTTSYQWLAPGEGVPVFEITESDFGAPTARYKSDEEVPISVPEASDRQVASISPTLCDTHFKVSGQDSGVPVLLFDLQGRQLAQFNQATFCDLSGLPAGCYIAVLQSQGKPHSERLIIR